MTAIATLNLKEAAKAKSKAKTPRRDPMVWPSVSLFRQQLEAEHKAEEGAPEYLGISPRYSLRVPLLKTLAGLGSVDAVTLRKQVCKLAGLDPQSARVINLHAWTLVDMQDAGFVTSFTANGKKYYQVPSNVRGILSVIELLDWHRGIEASSKKEG